MEYFHFGYAFGIIKSDNSDAITENSEVISNTVNDIHTLVIDSGFTNLQIKIGDTFKVETNNSNIGYEEKNGKVEIKEKDNNKWFKINKKYESDLTIYIPENMKPIEDVKIENGAGKLYIESLKAEKLDLNIGAGTVYIENLKVSKKIKIDGGVGKTEIYNAEINDLDADLGVGEFIFKGNITGNSSIDSGVGSTKITLINDVDNYKIRISKGVGSITLNGKSVSDNETYGAGSNNIKISGGVGRIEINTDSTSNNGNINTNKNDTKKEISTVEAENIIKSKYGTYDDYTGNVINYAYMATIKDKQGNKYYAFRQSWFVEDHNSFLQNIFISLDGETIKTSEEPKFFEDNDIVEF